MRLIDVDALEKAINEWMPKDKETWLNSEIPPNENLVVSIMMTIQEQPTVDSEPVRHGKWDYVTVVDEGFWRCSNCGTPSEAIGAKKLYKYCPFCGAKMDGGEHGTDK